jgi:hypothetical protein
MERQSRWDKFFCKGELSMCNIVVYYGHQIVKIFKRMVLLVLVGNSAEFRIPVLFLSLLFRFGFRFLSESGFPPFFKDSGIDFRFFFRGTLFPPFVVNQERGEPPPLLPPPHTSLLPTVMKLSDPLVGITIKFEHPNMVDRDDRSDSGDEGNPRGFSQESSDSLPPLCFKTIWDCPGITLDEMANHDDTVILGWRCGYCPVPCLGIGAAPFYKYRNATKALSQLSSKSKDIHRCKGYKNIPTNVRNALTALQYVRLNERSDRAACKNTIVEEVINHQANTLSLKEISR